jgi:hypothetical protein
MMWNVRVAAPHSPIERALAADREWGRGTLPTEGGASRTFAERSFAAVAGSGE